MAHTPTPMEEMADLPATTLQQMHDQLTEALGTGDITLGQYKRFAALMALHTALGNITPQHSKAAMEWGQLLLTGITAEAITSRPADPAGPSLAQEMAKLRQDVRQQPTYELDADTGEVKVIERRKHPVPR